MHFLTDSAPNPVIATIPLPDQGTARIYWNGMVDAIDGSFYSVSPGFDSLADLWKWIQVEARAIAAPYDALEWLESRDEFSHGLGEILAV